MSDLRIGVGVDAHAFEDGARLVLGGVAIEHPRGLAGHSDGDVIAHALTDAVLGAAGLGDIGALFPSGDARWHGADSLDLLRDAYAQVREAGFALVNADCVLIGEEPRIAGHRDEMRRRLARRSRRRAGARERPRDHHGPARVHRPRRRARGRSGRPPGARMKIVSYVERPDLLERRDELGAAWDEFMYHDAVANVYWNRQYEEFPDLQLFLLDEDDRLLAESNAVPIPFGPDELPDDGWDAALEQAFAGRPATAVSAIAITIGVEQRGQGLSRTMLDGMRKAVAARGLSDLVAPVRPSQKHVYPLTPMERYVEWRRDDGKLLDAWLRTHEQAGAELIRVAPASMRITGSVADWESWTGLRFPDSGPYVVPGALVPVEIDRERDEGVYVEPNVWMHHRV